VDRRRVNFDAELDENRTPLGQTFRGFLGLPDVEYLDLTVRVEGDVMKPTGPGGLDQPRRAGGVSRRTLPG
jgi:hypothetical protein